MIEEAGPQQTGMAAKAQDARMRPVTATCGETYTDCSTRAVADNTQVEMAVRSTHLARVQSADSGHAS